MDFIFTYGMTFKSEFKVSSFSRGLVGVLKKIGYMVPLCNRMAGTRTQVYIPASCPFLPIDCFIFGFQRAVLTQLLTVVRGKVAPGF